MISLANQKDILLIHNAMKVTEVDLFNLVEVENNVRGAQLKNLSRNLRARNEINRIKPEFEIHS